MQTTTYVLPAHWAPALINDDWSGLEDDDAADLQIFLDSEDLGHAIDVSHEPFFAKYHDAEPYHVLACDCLEFTFPVPEPEETWFTHPSLTVEERNPTLR